MTIEAIVTNYLNAWNETDAARRRAALEALCTADCHYADPLAVVNGRDELDALIAAVQRQFPGLTFSLAGAVDRHHAQARFTWHAAPPGAAEPAAVGFDVVLLDGDRIRSVYGFLDKAPG
ncbi:MAG TPA: nuclear transport factor 2 family protein [Polyangiaceae bacterium]|nr:nuclear transport factor 2 family protein [Polyangiaceae bacterium]